MKKKTSGNNDIYKSIYEKILSGEYPAGYHLVEMDLAAEYHVSRTPVRLAIERLVAEGLAKHVPHKGAVVRRLTRTDILNMFAVREVTEGLAARLASQHVTEEDRIALNGIMQEMDQALESQDLHAYYSVCGKVHSYIFDLAQNEFLRDIIQNIYAITSRYHVAVLRLPGRPSGSKEEHHLVVVAVLSGDGDLAERTMKEHVRHCGDFYRDEQNQLLFRSLAQLEW